LQQEHARGKEAHLSQVGDLTQQIASLEQALAESQQKQASEAQQMKDQLLKA
jgi:hypothetical protein